MSLTLIKIIKMAIYFGKKPRLAQKKPITSESNVNLLVTTLRFFKGESSCQPFTL